MTDRIFPQKTVREGAVDSVRGVENVIELYKDPEYGNDWIHEQLGLSQDYMGCFFFSLLREEFRVMSDRLDNRRARRRSELFNT